jgi:hypothetical protein
MLASLWGEPFFAAGELADFSALSLVYERLDCPLQGLNYHHRFPGLLVLA